MATLHKKENIFLAFSVSLFKKTCKNVKCKNVPFSLQSVQNGF